MFKQLKTLVGIFALSAAAIVLPDTAAADNNLYAGVSVGHFKQSANAAGFIDNNYSAGYMIFFGGQTNEYFATEVRYGTTGKANLPFTGTPVAPTTLETTIFSGLLKGILPIQENFHIYGIGGFSTGSISASGGLSGKTQKGDISYGFGLEYISEQWGASIEGISYLHNIEAGPSVATSVSAISAHIRYNF